ncbi:hypothetical protein ACFL34_04205 [Candidatus Sumerlaeota bacterium]
MQPWRLTFVLLGLLIVLTGAVELPQPADEIESKLGQVAEDWQALSKAFVSLGIDNCGIYLPSDTSWRSSGRPTFETMRIIHPFAPIASAGGRATRCLTTPLAYIAKYPQDPFSPGQNYGYVMWSYFDREPPLAFLHSPGPDGDIDVRLARLYSILHERLLREDGSRGPLHPDLFDRVDPCVGSLMTRFAYDPTNGLTSNGDLINFFNLYTASRPRPPQALRTLEDSEFNALLKKFPADVAIARPRWQDEGNKNVSFTLETTYFPVRRSFYDHFRDYLAVDGSPSSDTLDSLANKLGGFADIFAEPQALSPPQLELLAQWRKDDPAWWALIDNIPRPPRADPYVYMERGRYARFFVFYGKSRLLDGCQLLAQGEFKQTFWSANGLYNRASRLSDNFSIAPASPFAKRVGTELCRMALKLRDMAEERATATGVKVYPRHPR